MPFFRKNANFPTFLSYVRTAQPTSLKLGAVAFRAGAQRVQVSWKGKEFLLASHYLVLLPVPGTVAEPSPESLQ